MVRNTVRITKSNYRVVNSFQIIIFADGSQQKMNNKEEIISCE